MGLADAFSAEEYEEAKKRVADARSQQKKLDTQRAAGQLELQKEVDGLRESLVQQAKDYEAKLETTKASAAAANDRAVRAKAAADKEKKSFQFKLDRYATQNEQLHAEQQETVAEMQRRQDEELADARLHTAKASQHAVHSLEQELRACILEAETRETRLRAQHAGEVEALAAGHRQQLQRAHNDAAEWHVRVEEGAGLCEQLRAAVQRAGEGEAAAKQQMVASERRVEQMDTELRQLECEVRGMKDQHDQEVNELNATHEACLAALKAKQDTEVGALHVRVKQTLDTKDATIAQLRAQLAASQQSQRATEEALRSL